MSDLKFCRTCTETKVLSDFHRKKGARDGLTTSCKKCIALRGKAYYLAHKKETSEACKKYRHNNADTLRKLEAGRYLTIGRRLTSYLSSARSRALKTGKECTITLPWLLERWENIGGKCEVTGIPLTLQRAPEDTYRSPFNLSLDRRDNKKGYTEENTRIVCVIVNIAINDFGDEHFMMMCRAAVTRGYLSEHY